MICPAGSSLLLRPRYMYVRLPRYACRAPLPDAKGDDAGKPGRDAPDTVDAYLPIDQCGRLTAASQIIVGLDVVQVHMWDEERDHGDW